MNAKKVFLVAMILFVLACGVVFADLTLQVTPFGGAVGDPMAITPSNESSNLYNTALVSIDNTGTLVATGGIQATIRMAHANGPFVVAASNLNTNASALSFETNAGSSDVVSGADVEVSINEALALTGTTATSLFWIRINPDKMLRKEVYWFAITMSVWKADKSKADYELEVRVKMQSLVPIGDVTCNGVVSTTDLLFESQQAAGLRDWIQGRDLMRSIMDTNGDREITSADVLNIANEIANPAFEMPVEKNGNPPLMAPSPNLIGGNASAKLVFRVMEMAELGQGQYEFVLRADGFPKEAVAVVADITAGGVISVIRGGLMSGKDTTFASAIRRGDRWVRIVFTKPTAFDTSGGVVAKIVVASPSIRINEVVVNDGQIPVGFFYRSDWQPRKVLLQNYPNPFNPETWIPYELSEPTNVNIRIFNANGVLVRAFLLGNQTAGFYTSKEKAVYWDGKNEAGENVSSGVYFYTIKAGDFSASKKMILLK